MQPGSSIMPGKVNPVIAESLLMVCAQVIGLRRDDRMVLRGGEFRAERDDAGDGVGPAGRDRTAGGGERRTSRSGWSTGWRRTGSGRRDSWSNRWRWGRRWRRRSGTRSAAALVKEAYATGRTVREVAREKSGIGEERLRELLDAGRQAG